MKRKLVANKLFVIAGAAICAVGVVGNFVLVSPQRSKQAQVAAEIEQTRAEIVQRRAASIRSRKVERLDDVFRLTTAMPDRPDVPGLMLELSRVARESGIEFDSIAPQPAVPGATGYQQLPIALTFDGNFYELSDFLFRLRNLVTVRDGSLDVNGRLLAIDEVEFLEGQKKFPEIRANLTAKAFVYGAAAPPAGAAPAAGEAPPASEPGGEPAAATAPAGIVP